MLPAVPGRQVGDESCCWRLCNDVLVMFCSFKLCKMLFQSFALFSKSTDLMHLFRREFLSGKVVGYMGHGGGLLQRFGESVLAMKKKDGV